jgi:hypothetical protein
MPRFGGKLEGEQYAAAALVFLVLAIVSVVVGSMIAVGLALLCFGFFLAPEGKKARAAALLAFVFGAVLVFYHGAVGNGLSLFVLAGFLVYLPDTAGMKKKIEELTGHMTNSENEVDKVVSAQMSKGGNEEI